jgi:hypothetical protein
MNCPMVGLKTDKQTPLFHLPYPKFDKHLIANT